MKKYVSIWMLAARGTLYKALGVMSMMGLAQVGVYYAALRAALAEREAEIQNQLLHPEYGTWNVPYPSLEDILREGLLGGWVSVTTIWVVGFVLLAIVLGTAGAPLKGGNSKTKLTLLRMPMKERSITVCYAIYNFAVMIIFWAFSIVMALLICELYYREADPSTYGTQSTFLMFYRNDLFHSLLPLAETLRYARNIFLFAAVGVVTACHSFWERRGRRSFWRLIAYLSLGTIFPKSLGRSGSDMWWIVISVGLIVAEIYCMLSRLEDGDQE